MASVADYDYRKTWPINPLAPADSFEAKAPFIDHGTGVITGLRYWSAEWMERERTQLWAKVWNWAGRVEQIPDAGDFIVFEVGRESFLVVRGDDGEIRAFFNVCPHRGNRLATEGGSVAGGFTCPFHRWQFGLDGTNTRVTDRETFRPEALCRNLDLSEVRCEVWDGFIFLNMDANAKPLLEHLGPLVEHAKPYRLGEMQIMRWMRSTWDANWKVGVDGFNEAYHVHAIHPEILTVFNDYHAQIDLYPNGMSRMVTKFAHESPRFPGASPGVLNDGLRAMMREVGLDPDRFEGRMEDVRPAVQAAKRARAERLGIDYSGFLDNQLTDDWNYDIFPNIQMGIHPEGVSLLYFRPHKHDPRKFIFDVIVMMHPQANSEILPPAYMGLPDGWDISGRELAGPIEIDWRDGGMGQVFDQDSGLFPLVQEGIESLGYRGAVLSEQEQRLRHFHAELDRYMVAPAR